jgi:hypothetical protein
VYWIISGLNKKNPTQPNDLESMKKEGNPNLKKREKQDHKTELRSCLDNSSDWSYTWSETLPS